MKGFGMSKTGQYIYGIINSSTKKRFDLGGMVGFEDIYPLRSPAEVARSSESFRWAYTISYRDIAAVVRDSQIADYSHVPNETLARVLVGHQQLAEKVMAEHTIIPMKLGTFTENADQIRQILTRGYGTIKNIFERVGNAAEIDVVATLNDFSSFLRGVSQEKEIESLRRSLQNKKEDGVTVDDQLRVGVLIKKHLDRKKAAYAERIQTALEQVSDGFKAHDVMDDKMVLNTAFLLRRNNQEDFERTLDNLDKEFEEQMNFRCVGPLPPYSFYTLEIKKLQFEQIDWARQQLGLTNDFVTADDIKKAHRRTALTCHPDKNQNAPDTQKKFDDMTRAYKILWDYYRASSQPERGRGCCLKEDAFEEDAVLVTTVG
jgi:Gas vesicle synthesis protein GvpL/GvpF/DnaJ domain